MSQNQTNLVKILRKAINSKALEHNKKVLIFFLKNKMVGDLKILSKIMEFLPIASLIKYSLF
jgi:hypothetical protein